MNVVRKDIRAFIFQRFDSIEAYEAVGQFRKRLFVDLLGWSLEVNDGKEQDKFDTDHAVYAVLMRGDTIVGSFRAIRADDDYLAAVVFPSLATTKPYPKRPDYWEISRFGVIPCEGGHEVATALYALMFQFALVRRTKALVAITDLHHERQLKRRGIKTRRYGKPSFIEVGEAKRPLAIVAGEVPVLAQDQTNLDRLLSSLNGVLINDQTLVLRRSRVPA